MHIPAVSDNMIYCLQVNAGAEPQKGGVLRDTWEETEEAAISLADFIVKKCPNLSFTGFMTVAYVLTLGCFLVHMSRNLGASIWKYMYVYI